MYKDNSDDNTWNTIYHNDVKPLSRLEKESKYSSKLLPTGDLPKPRNSHDSVAGNCLHVDIEIASFCNTNVVVYYPIT